MAQILAINHRQDAKIEIIFIHQIFALYSDDVKQRTLKNCSKNVEAKQCKTSLSFFPGENVLLS